ncbi:hypothetical protein KC678_01445 [Candidatus Dojkabacteria bacterium]|uniref:Uncharacterized protein n=1 Tax=Candidatus Dojkabacteria bacterium TaxID=2099670 RepID=A0A955IAZ4_9BACT|nr:hypothetical protein [Candidatus Dojkabacteria bacterium]
MGILGLLVSVVSTAAQISASRRQARAQREATAISTASQDIRDTLSRRRLAREERIRRARLISGSMTSGGSGSSGELGASFALRSNVDQSIATQTSEALAVNGISAANQRAADAQSSMYAWQAFGNLVSSATDLYKTATS